VCILLAFLTALGCFHVDAWLIDLFCNLLRGLLGYGFWAVPVMLAVAGGILAFHRGRPVRLRVWCALLTPVLFGCLLHLFLASGEAPAWGWSLFPELWKSGEAMTSGGAVSGLLAQLCIAGISKYGAGAVFIVGTALLLLAAFNLTVVDVVDYIRSRPHPEYEEEELPEPPRSRRTSARSPPQRPSPDARRARHRYPVDDGPLAGMPDPSRGGPHPRKELLFNASLGAHSRPGPHWGAPWRPRLPRGGPGGAGRFSGSSGRLAPGWHPCPVPHVPGRPVSRPTPMPRSSGTG
jgi:S-DNA-T family DNA segregation ATPase FtsK/SpoIIIE